MPDARDPLQIFPANARARDHRTPQRMPRVTLRANGFVTPSYLVKLPETYAGLLKLADIKLGEGFGSRTRSGKVSGESAEGTSLEAGAPY
jgi:hypothetical protein